MTQILWQLPDGSFYPYNRMIEGLFGPPQPKSAAPLFDHPVVKGDAPVAMRIGVAASTGNSVPVYSDWQKFDKELLTNVERGFDVTFAEYAYAGVDTSWHLIGTELPVRGRTVLFVKAEPAYSWPSRVVSNFDIGFPMAGVPDGYTHWRYLELPE